MNRIYLDYAATTPLLPEAFQAMRPWLENEFGNPSSLYLEGRRAKSALDEARETLSGALGCLFGEVIFTSSGTEAANLALLGAALGNEDPRRKRVLIGAAEHHCVLHTAPLLERLGFQTETLQVDRQAWINLEDLQQKIDDDVLLVAVMHANNELGTINPVQKVGEIAHQKGALFFCDGVQSFLTQVQDAPWKVDDLNADLLSVCAHKIGGPKGVGALYMRGGTKLKALSVGGGQERDMRAGTENVAHVVGFAEAVRWHQKLQQENPGAAEAHKATVRAAFLDDLAVEAQMSYVLSVSDLSAVLPGHAHLRFPGLQAESVLIRLDQMGVCASSGAACSSGSLEPSHVLLACGYSRQEAKEGLRFTFGHQTNLEEAKEAARRVGACVNALVRI